MSLSFFINAVVFSLVAVALLSLAVKSDAILLGCALATMAKLYEVKG